jgi:fructokinase
MTDDLASSTISPPPRGMSPLDVIGLGELLWDCFPDRRCPGGAPANVAFHAQQLGLRAAVATRVGSDALGTELLRFLEQQGLSTDLVQSDAAHPTSTVTVTPDAPTGPQYTFLADCAWDFLAATPAWLQAMSQSRVVVFGTLAQRSQTSRDAVLACLHATGNGTLRVFDVNLRPPFATASIVADSLPWAHVLKLNDNEVHVLSDWFRTGTNSLESFGQWALASYPQLKLVAITRGGDGAIGISRTGVVSVPGEVITVADTVGAGDAFTAGLVFGWLRGDPLTVLLRRANRMGALVASRSGAMPRLDAADLSQLVEQP